MSGPLVPLRICKHTFLNYMQVFKKNKPKKTVYFEL